ncbi:hypothetical protein JRI60_51350 [Archangium violaceum]|uniref:hypothetical protein n=1 Tax=Archangium violaceum TaxID=83451 RepID=UPI00194DFAF3|nr:hypothetical protein [Archangium violaceum]QRN97253.1 hypothetical protein JRI60_51350 [Archangium violaceum]
MSLPIAVSATSHSPTEPVSCSEPKSFRQVIPLTDARPQLRVIHALSPGQGDSPYIGVFDSRRAPGSDLGELRLLFEVHRGLGRHQLVGPAHVRMSVWLLPDSPGEGGLLPVPGLVRREVPLSQPSRAGACSSPVLEGGHVAALPYAVLREGLARLGKVGAEAFSLAHLFHRRFRVMLELCAGDIVLSCDESQVELYDLGRFGSLYQRVLEGLVRPDTRAQEERLGVRRLAVAHHPWYPVLAIGMDKARLYQEAIESDLSLDTTHLEDPRWLVRVGLYLELFTVLGIVEAVRTEYPDLLSPEERRMVDTAPALAPIRERLDVAAWREVWALRHIATPALRWLRLGPVGPDNLLRKQRATLAFLETHHEDLLRALELAGPALGGTREVWLRVFRDAERAVLRNADAVFPELRALSPAWREQALWHECGDLEALGLGRVPGWLSGLVGDRDGVFASASRQYRRSMNVVARRARELGWMDFAGEECIPREASLIEALLDNERARLAESPLEALAWARS